MKIYILCSLLALTSITANAQISKIGNIGNAPNVPSDFTLSSGQDAFIIENSAKTRGIATNGVVIMSSDNTLPNPVLGFTDSGNFDLDEMPDNVRYWLGLYVNEIDNWQQTGISSARLPQTRAIHSDVEPFVEAMWNQYSPYNDLCPEYQGRKTLTGCVATATAIAMSVYKYPQKPTGKIDYTTSKLNIHITDNLDEYEFDWDNILPSYYDNYSQAQGNAVAKLIYAAGIAANMDYGLNGSSASFGDALSALVNNFGYDKDVVRISRSSVPADEWHEMLISTLELKQPIMYDGQSPTGGHGFIIDGVKILDGEPYYHVNWGWGGAFNGYYRLNDMKPEGSGNGPYNDRQAAILGIAPDDGVLKYESLLVASSIALSSSHIISGEASNKHVKFTDLENSHNQTFEGIVKFYLIGNNKEYYIGQSNFSLNLPPSYYYPNIDMSVQIPADILDGEYRLEARSVAKDGTKEQRVIVASGNQVITVSPTKPVNKADIMATSYAIGIENNLITLSANEIMNYSNEQFTGSLQMALADGNGNIIEQIGYPYTCYGLNYLSSYTSAITLRANLPEGLGDGTYRIYLVANQEDTEGWSFVTGYNVSNNTITEHGSELYAQIIVTDGVAEASEDNLPEFFANIQVTEMTLIDFNKDSKTFTVEANRIGNFGDTDFYGKISLAIKDTLGNYHTFGSPFLVKSRLSHYSYFTNPQTIVGSINEDLGDGVYKLVLVAKQDGYRGWSEVKKWGSTNGYISGSDSECAILLWILDGVITLEGPTHALSYFVDDQEFSTMQVAWGSNIDLIDEPTREGYTFSGWSGYPEDLIMPNHDIRIDGTFTKNFVYVSEIKLNLALSLIEKDKPVQLTATIMPEDADNKNIVWKSNDTNVVTVDENGLVTYVGRGKATVTAETTDGSSVKASCEFYTKWLVTYMVDDAEYQTEEVVPGETISLIDVPTREGYTFSGWSGYPMDLLMPENNITISGYFNKDVVYVTTILLNTNTISAEVGETFQLEVSVAPSDADNKQIAWSSGNTSVATVSDTGLVTVIAAGSAIITAEASDGSGVKATCVITGYMDIKSLYIDDTIKDIYILNGQKASSKSYNELIIIKDKNGKAKKMIRK